MSNCSKVLLLPARLGVLAAILFSASTYAQNQLASTVPDYSLHKTLLIGVDGMQYEKLQQAIQDAMAPNIGGLTLAKSYVGGVAGSTTQQVTNSGPGWTTILTGAWVDRHQVKSNSNGLRNQTTSLFEYIKTAAEQRRTASIVSWNTINHNLANDIEKGYIDLAVMCDDKDVCVADKASYEIEYGQHDFIFAHFDEPDLVGHSQGFTPPYQTAIQGVDYQVGQLLTALENRQNSHPEENWLVIVTPDHGRETPAGHNHGAQTLSEKTTFIALNKAPNEQLSAPIKDPVNPEFDGLYGYASQADIAPTILAHMGVQPVVEQYVIDGTPLIGPMGVRHLSHRLDTQARSVTLNWRPVKPRGEALTVYRNGVIIGTLTDAASEFVDSALPDTCEPLNYTVVTRGLPVSVLVPAPDKAG